MEDVLATMTIRCVGYEKILNQETYQMEKLRVISTVKYRLDHKSLGTMKRMAYQQCTLEEYSQEKKNR